jgi:WD40 repeat protein
MTGELIASHSPYSHTLGVKNLSISPSGNYYGAVGYYDGKLRLYNNLSWKEIIAFEHSSSLNLNDNKENQIVVYKEEPIAKENSTQYINLSNKSVI